VPGAGGVASRQQSGLSPAATTSDASPTGVAFIVSDVLTLPAYRCEQTATGQPEQLPGVVPCQPGAGTSPRRLASVRSQKAHPSVMRLRASGESARQPGVRNPMTPPCP
jgi:hypothetical protein